MTRLEALERVYERVKKSALISSEGGFYPRDVFEAFDECFDENLWDTFAGAYEGSIDDAVAFFEATLPAYWYVTITISGKALIEEVGEDRWRELGKHQSWEGCREGKPARALIIAILKALIAQEHSQ